MTKKLYYKDPYKREFDAVITDVRTDDNGVKVLLDATCFYPEGGGQPADRGTINGTSVTDVRKEADEVIHVLEGEPVMSKGGMVHGVLDWDHRFDFMQQHTGQHLISGAFYQIAGIGTVSVHLGEEISTVELDVESAEIETLASVEKRVNQSICMNLPVQTDWVDEEELDTGSLRRELKVSGAIRVVSVEETDRVACGGVHVGRTGEIGLVKLIGTEIVRNHLRTIWKIGQRAYDDYELKTQVCGRLIDLFSSPLADLETAAKNNIEKLGAAEKALHESAEKRAADAAASLLSAGDSVITAVFNNEESKFLKSVATSLIGKGTLPFCLLNLQEGRVQWLAGVPSGSGDTNLKPLIDELLPIIDGKGGGKPPLWQGVGTKLDAADDFLSSFRERAGV